MITTCLLLIGFFLTSLAGLMWWDKKTWREAHKKAEASHKRMGPTYVVRKKGLGWTTVHRGY